MATIDSFLTRFSQNKKLPIRIVSPGFGQPSAAMINEFGLSYRSPFYGFFFMIAGSSKHTVDLKSYKLNADELLFLLPHQLVAVPEKQPGTNFIKLGFDDSCLGLLPRQYPFLVDPLNNQQISFTASAARRVQAIFAMLLDLLSEMDTSHEVILAHLNSLLTEIDTAYFQNTTTCLATAKNPANSRLSKYIDFRLFLEKTLTDHLPVSTIAEQLALHPNSLYQIVKHYSGLSPKAFINNRLILEARRHLYYNANCSVKELAFELGFNDPEYFSRLFKKLTGQTIASFSQDL